MGTLQRTIYTPYLRNLQVKKISGRYPTEKKKVRRRNIRKLVFGRICIYVNFVCKSYIYIYTSTVCMYDVGIYCGEITKKNLFNR